MARKHHRFSFIETNLLVGFSLSLIVCTSGIRADSVAAERAQVELHQQELHQLFQNFFQDYLQLFPTFATRIGDHGYDDKLQIEISEEHRQKQRTLYSSYLRKLSEIDRGSLQNHDRLNYDLFKYELTLRFEGLQFNDHLTPDFKPESLFRAIAPRELGGESGPLKTVYYYNDYIKRLAEVPTWVNTAVANMRKGMVQGVVDSKYVVEDSLRRIDRMLVLNVQWNLFYQPIVRMPPAISNADKARIKRETTQVIEQAIIPAYKKLSTFIRQEYLPKTTTSLGISGLPGGRARYPYLVKTVTTTNLTPDEIFQMGMDEIKRLKKEVQQMQEKMGFKRSLGAFQMYLEENTPKYSKQNLIKAYEALGTNVTARLPQLFGRLPKISYKIKAVEGLKGAGIAGAYEDAIFDGSHQGVVYIDRSSIRVGLNVSLFLHEAIPGHHLQISLQPEGAGLPAFRRYRSYTAFLEGWATYAESLGQDLGLYGDPYQRLVYLRSELSKALKLVVAVGIYHKGWNTLQAHRIWAEEGGRLLPVSPIIEPAGRSMAYKIGQLKISAIRSKAEKSLGSKFDIRAFHDELLKDGALPLDLLEAKMDTWVASQLR